MSARAELVGREAWEAARLRELGLAQHIMETLPGEGGRLRPSR